MNGLLDELETEARRLAWQLDALGKLPAGFVERHYPLTMNEQRELRRLKTALSAATDIDTFLALCKGYPVPESRLNRRPIEQYDRMVTSGS